MNLYEHEKLQEAFALYVERQNALLPDDETVSAMTLSEDFQKRMRTVLNRQKHGFYVLFGTAGRRAASILLTVLTTAAVTTVSVEALREPVVQFFTRIYERFTQVFFVDDTPDARMVEMELYLPTYIPEGYELEEEEVLPYIHRATYKHSNSNNKIHYKQRWKESGLMVADTENTQYSPVNIGDYEGIAYRNKDMFTLIYSNNLYTYTLSAPLPLDELIEIAKSIQKK